MNEVFIPFLSRIVFVFLYDILVYSKTPQKHVYHLKKVLEILKQHQIFSKLTKCKFGVEEIDYLGHLINAEGVKSTH